MQLRTAGIAIVLSGVLAGATPTLRAQASAIPSAQSATEGSSSERARKLLDQMVAALGGDAWLNRKDWTVEGKGATFYKGSANPYVTGFIEYHRPDPFGVRVVLISRFGIFIPTDHRDTAVVWTADNGYEVSYKGKKELPRDEVDDYMIRRKHTLDVVVKDWLKQPGALVTYEGTKMVERRLVDQVSILTNDNDGMEIRVDAATHLPVSISFVHRDRVFKDLDTEVEQYDDYHEIQGIMTPLTITRLHNGDMVSQRFLTKMTYNNNLSGDLFDPNRPLQKKIK